MRRVTRSHEFGLVVPRNFRAVAAARREQPFDTRAVYYPDCDGAGFDRRCAAAWAVEWTYRACANP